MSPCPERQRLTEDLRRAQWGSTAAESRLGVEVDSTEAVDAQQARLTEQGFFADEERGTTRCYAAQDKFWVTAPDGERWEHYTVLADSPTFAGRPSTASEGGPACCAG